jgi:hypothetical protein
MGKMKEQVRFGRRNAHKETSRHDNCLARAFEVQAGGAGRTSATAS